MRYSTIYLFFDFSVFSSVKQKQQYFLPLLSISLYFSLFFIELFTPKTSWFCSSIYNNAKSWRTITLSGLLIYVQHLRQGLLHNCSQCVPSPGSSLPTYLYITHPHALLNSLFNFHLSREDLLDNLFYKIASSIFLFYPALFFSVTLNSTDILCICFLAYCLSFFTRM